jgi:DNA polymerase theta
MPAVNATHQLPCNFKILHSAGVIVATIEKDHMLVDRLSEQGLGRLSCVVVDELHMVGDEERGYLLELMLNKLR